MHDYFQSLIANCAAEWRAIPGYEGLYEASSTGLIRSCERITKNSGKLNYECRTRQCVLKMYERKSANRYRSVGLSKNGVIRTTLVHDAVFCAFNGIHENRRQMVIDHRDGNEHNNSIGNLRLVTAAENITKRKTQSETYGIWKHRDKWVAEIRKDKKKIHIGTYATKELALSARIAKERELFGEFSPMRGGISP